jgi:hypothetical protein
MYSLLLYYCWDKLTVHAQSYYFVEAAEFGCAETWSTTLSETSLSGRGGGVSGSTCCPLRTRNFEYEDFPCGICGGQTGTGTDRIFKYYDELRFQRVNVSQKIYSCAASAPSAASIWVHCLSLSHQNIVALFSRAGRKLPTYYRIVHYGMTWFSQGVGSRLARTWFCVVELVNNSQSNHVKNDIL